MSFLTSLFSAIKGIASLIGLIKELISLANQARREGWIQDGKQIVKKVKEAKSDEDRKKMVKAIADHFGDMP